jgi:hypothetical protein
MAESNDFEHSSTTPNAGVLARRQRSDLPRRERLHLHARKGCISANIAIIMETSML